MTSLVKICKAPINTGNVNCFPYVAEASLDWNFIFISTKSNFKFSDFEGKGASWTINAWIISISIFGNTSPGYPTNSIFDSLIRWSGKRNTIDV